jgi:carboxylate-amine ligase
VSGAAPIPAVAGTAAYDEAWEAPGVPRSHYAALLAHLQATDLRALAGDVGGRLAAAGVSFGEHAGPGSFEVDVVPRILPGAEWRALAAGLEQRVRALNAFLADAYGERRIVRAGLMDAAVIDDAEGYEPELQGRLPPLAAPAALAGLDVVRDPAGRLFVLEDNLRAPSGFAYAVAARAAVDAALPALAGALGDVAGPVRDALRDVLRCAAPLGTAGEPVVVVLSDGPGASSFWEHEQVAGWLGAPVVTPADLEARGGRVWLRGGHGARRAVDVVYRRCDEDRVRDDAGRLTPLAGLLLEPWLAGRVGVVNAFGTGLGDDKLVHAHVEAMVRFYLGEEPLVPSVPAADLADPAALEAVLGDLPAHVVKPRHGAGGEGVVVCAHAEDEDLRRLSQELRARPGDFVAQRTILLSEHPTGVDGRLEPRHVDLRPFVASTPAGVRTLPAALTRVALDEGALVVNSHQNGGAKATWVLS